MCYRVSGEIAGHNKTLGKFELVGIPPAPRGVPQVEVTFDIDANGIVHVSAKDLGTGKEQSIKITASSGLSEDEIKQMIRDAEEHAEEDKAKRDEIEARNQLDSLVYSTEKSLKEHGDALEAEEKNNVEKALTDAKSQLENGGSAEAMKAEVEKLSAAAQVISKKIYEAAAKEQEGNFSGDANGSAEASADAGASDDSDDSDDDVVDADFEEVR